MATVAKFKLLLLCGRSSSSSVVQIRNSRKILEKTAFNKCQLLYWQSYSNMATMNDLKPDRNPVIKFTDLFINNEWHKSVSMKKFPVINPATKQVIAECQEGSKEDVEKAVTAAQEAFELGSPWRSMNASKRGQLLYKLANLLQSQTSYLASLETLNTGKPFAQAVDDVLGAARTFEYFAGWTDKTQGKVLPMDGKYFAYTRHEPVGVCGLIVPWNYPLVMMSWKVAPALAAGNVVIVKPSEQTPLTTLYFAELVKQVGIPAGVFNVIPGYGPTAGAAIVEHQGVDKISFTGSTQVGKIVLQSSGLTNLKRVTLELGGKSPFIIFGDVNVDEAVKMAHHAVLINQGQVCSAGSRTFVHADIYEEFVKKSVELAQKRKVGDPFDLIIDQGPQIDKKQFDKVLHAIKTLKEEGATLLAGGQQVGDQGYFVQPTVFTDVTDDMTYAKEEIFGPVQMIFKFHNVDEVIKRANSTLYGLAAGIMTKDSNKINRLVSSLKSGTVWVNCYDVFDVTNPFGGYKMSGFGRELGEYGLQPYTEIKTVVVSADDNC